MPLNSIAAEFFLLYVFPSLSFYFFGMEKAEKGFCAGATNENKRSGVEREKIHVEEKKRVETHLITIFHMKVP
jgi:hypothetical protein